MRKETIAIIGLVVTILSLLPFSDILGLIITPSFKVEIDSYYDRDKNHYQSLTIDNIGLEQAKNANVSIRSSYPLVTTESQCIEGKILNDNSTVIQIEFARFSQNVQCYVEFLSQYDRNIFKVEVTAEDAEGYTYSYGEETQTFGARLAIMLLSSLVIVLSMVLIRNKRKSSQTSFNVSNYPTTLGLELIKKYGQGFNEDDEEILRSIKRDKNTTEEISIFTDLKESYVEDRLEFMEQKEVVYEIRGIWYIDDNSFEKKVPK